MQQHQQQQQRQHSEASRNILLLGGGGFIGSHVARSLLRRGFNVTSLQRSAGGGVGRWRWRREFGDEVRVVVCDRNYDLHVCEGLPGIEEVRFLAVVDLSGFVDLAVMQSVQLLRHSFSLYVFVSCGCVYDICDKKSGAAALEEDGVFPRDASLRAKLRTANPFAEKKLTAEFIVDMLAAEHNGRFDYVILRAPDVFGQRDASHRFWYYADALRRADARDDAVRLPTELRDARMSLAYAGDVGDFVGGLVDGYRRRAQPVQQIYNFAYPTALTLPELLRRLAAAMRLRRAPRFEFDDAAKRLYPSFASGPLSVEKLLKHFNESERRMTPLDSALEESWSFYEAAEKAGVAEYAEEFSLFRQKLKEWGVEELPDFLQE